MALSGGALLALRAASAFLAPHEEMVDFSPPSRAAATQPAKAGDPDRRLRFAVATMVSAEETFSTYRRLVRWVCRAVGRPQAFVVRPSYADVRRALEEATVDVALVCTGTYVYSRENRRVELLVQPEFEQGLSYRCLFLVPAGSRLRTIEDLRGSVMAMTDRESHTGCLVPCAMLANRGLDTKSYFRKVLFTGSHDRSVLAVARNVVDVAAVDALVWESTRRAKPALADQVRVIWRSAEFGPPPIVVPVGLKNDLKEALRRAFLTMHEDPQGRRILAEIGIRRFVPARAESYVSAVALLEELRRHGGVSWP